MKKPKGYWTYDKCKEESLKYKSRTEFSKKSNGAYMSSYKNNWLDDICSHMTKIKKPNGYWTKEKCKEEALKYNNIKEFRIKGKGAYNSSYKNKWIKDITKHMIYNQKIPNYWTKEKCKEEALKYKSRTEFSKKSKSAYIASNRNNWLDETCLHMTVKGNRFNKCIYSYEFSDNHVYVGLTYNLDKRQKNRNKNNKDQVTKHIKETDLQPIRKQLTDYIDVKEAIKLEKFYVEKYKDDGWVILNVAKTGGLGGGNKKWTKEKCKEEALKYNTKTELKNNNGSVYTISLKNDWLNDICSHMIKLRKPNGYWTKEKCKEDALKYNTRTEFKNKNKPAYENANKNKWLKDICLHMIEIRKPKGYWTYERCKKESLNYKTKSNFIKNNKVAYLTSCKNNWINDFYK